MQSLVSGALILCSMTFGMSARADIITIEGTVKSVDTKKRTITVESSQKEQTLDVSSKAKISIGEEDESLESGKVGQKVALSYHDQLEVVVKVEVIALNLCELVEFTEINTGKYTADPWLSHDGLNIYWVTDDDWIWSASRKVPNSTFENKQRLMKGSMPTVSSDGLEMIFVGPPIEGQQGSSLFVTKRQSADAIFESPKLVAEAKRVDFPRNPCLSTDGLTLYISLAFDASIIHRPNATPEDRQNNWTFASLTRKSRMSAWTAPRPVRFERNGIDGKLTWLFPSSDGLALLCAREGRTEKQEAKDGMIMIWTRDSVNEAFSRSMHIQVAGLPQLVGRSPRYSPDTRELVFARYTGNGKFGLWSIRNIDLPEFRNSK